MVQELCLSSFCFTGCRQSWGSDFLVPSPYSVSVGLGTESGAASLKPVLRNRRQCIERIALRPIAGSAPKRRGTCNMANVSPKGGGAPPLSLEHRAFVRTADVRTAQAERGASDFCRANRGRVGTTRAALFQKRKLCQGLSRVAWATRIKTADGVGLAPAHRPKRLGHLSLWKSLYDLWR